MAKTAKRTIKRPEKISDLMKKVRECIETDRYYETIHFGMRKRQRNIDFQDVLFVLLNGRHEARKDQYDEAYKAWNYAIRGAAFEEKEELRVIISFDENEMLIITAFYL